MQQCRREILRDSIWMSHSGWRPSRRIGLSTRMFGPSPRDTSWAGIINLPPARGNGALNSSYAGPGHFTTSGEQAGEGREEMRDDATACTGRGQRRQALYREGRLVVDRRQVRSWLLECSFGQEAGRARA